MAKLALFRDAEPGLSDLLPYAALVADGVLLLKDGSLMASWYYAGPDAQSATNADRNEFSRQVNQVLARFGSGWMLQSQALRLPARGYPLPGQSSFPDPVSALIDAERRQHFGEDRAYFETRHALTLTFRDPQPQSSKMGGFVFAGANENPKSGDAALTRFLAAIAEFEQMLGAVIALERMGRRSVSEGQTQTASYDQLLQFIRFCITNQNHPMRLPPVPMYVDALLSGEFLHGLEPRIDDTAIAVVGIDGLPTQSWPGILNGLDVLPLSYRWSTRFIALDGTEARRHLERTRRKWQQKVRPFLDQLFQTRSGALDQDAAGMVSETESAIAAANSQLVAYGYYTSAIVLFGHDRQELREQAEFVRQAIQAEGFGARIETLNATEAYLGSLPGNWYANIRAPLVHSANLADLLPLSDTWQGAAHSPCPFYPPGSPPLMQVAAGSTPFRLNLHLGDIGHTLIFGPTGSGKSTLLATIAAQFLRYADAQVFVFDKGRSILPLTLAVGGNHIQPGEEPLAFAPLGVLDSAADRGWAAEWLETLISLQGVVVLPEHRNAIARQLELMAAQPHRSLSDFVAGVQLSALKEALRYYTIEGPMGHLLDAQEDGLTLARFQTFEVETLMAMGERHLVPVLLYLFRRIERRLTGTPSLIILDEAWLMLGHGVFRAKIREWLKVLRKANCAVVLATQSISDAQQSGILDVLKESCPTKICLANPAARESGSGGFYQALGLNPRQIEVIAQARPKRDYYLVQGESSRLFELALGPIGLSFVGASGQKELSRILQLHALHGVDWPRHWLRERGVDHGTT